MDIKLDCFFGKYYKKRIIAILNLLKGVFKYRKTECFVDNFHNHRIAI